jgi:hypothetical protein
VWLILGGTTPASYINLWHSNLEKRSFSLKPYSDGEKEEFTAYINVADFIILLHSVGVNITH